MTSRDFCYWLQGVFEVGKVEQLDKEQTTLIKRHLALVFLHEIDPSQGDAEHQAKLTRVHEGWPEELQGIKRRLDAVESRPSGSGRDPLIRC